MIPIVVEMYSIMSYYSSVMALKTAKTIGLLETGYNNFHFSNKNFEKLIYKPILIVGALLGERMAIFVLFETRICAESVMHSCSRC